MTRRILLQSALLSLIVPPAIQSNPPKGFTERKEITKPEPLRFDDMVIEDYSEDKVRELMNAINEEMMLTSGVSSEFTGIYHPLCCPLRPPIKMSHHYVEIPSDKLRILESMAPRIPISEKFKIVHFDTII